ncbi:hypothetical protein G7K_1823-t1 [Saitoella complicata NRRL Y-17804]|uniref:Uncharacterized protein n=1 Tax=Saitoella complicata (strain BCRC 22490 / CBS 7301 / JCM 7358 / NBRC 10748 / NRRL Y-17804) TaxID=698492 RepID=A0A0E9NCU7_SAICN|nr:hypothetical protein G7K_1823-t1 [Saitoella complicata NRRL Y-17804]
MKSIRYQLNFPGNNYTEYQSIRYHCSPTAFYTSVPPTTTIISTPQAQFSRPNRSSRSFSRLHNHLCNTPTTKHLAARKLLPLHRRKPITSPRNRQKQRNNNQTRRLKRQTRPLHPRHHQINHTPHPIITEPPDKRGKILGQGTDAEEEWDFDEDEEKAEEEGEGGHDYDEGCVEEVGDSEGEAEDDVQETEPLCVDATIQLESVRCLFPTPIDSNSVDAPREGAIPEIPRLELLAQFVEVRPCEHSLKIRHLD